MRTRRLVVGSAVLAAGFAVAFAAPAQAAVTEYHCSAGGFTGYVRLSPNTGTSTIYYKILKGSNTGGNKANVETQDNGVAPTKKLSTASGIQDGAFHALGTYARGHGGFAYQFTFDKSGSDPSCSGGGSV